MPANLAIAFLLSGALTLCMCWRAFYLVPRDPQRGTRLYLTSMAPLLVTLATGYQLPLRWLAIGIFLALWTFVLILRLVQGVLAVREASPG